jgi:hypothetical protein
VSLQLALSGHLIGRYYAAIGAARVLAGQWPGLQMHWEGLLPVLAGGPASVEEAAEVIHARSLDPALRPGGGLPGVIADDIPAKVSLGAMQDSTWRGPDGPLWQYALTGAGRTWLHPMIAPHAAQTIRGMIRKAADVCLAEPDLMARTMAGRGHTSPAYPGGLWLERACGEGGDPASGPPAIDWLTLMALPFLPVREIPRPDTVDLEWMGSAVGWGLACAERWHTKNLPVATRMKHPVTPYARWRLWDRPVPVVALGVLLASPRAEQRGGPWFGARRRARKKAADQPLMQKLDLAGVRDHDRALGGQADPWMPPRVGVAEAAARCQVAPATWRGYVARKQAPQPDGRDGQGRPWWYVTTLDAWQRPGQGARTDREQGRRSPGP